MTPAALADLHALCFTVPPPFTERGFADLLNSQTSFLITQPGGFALGRAAAGEAELLTLAVHPDQRRDGLGRALLTGFEAEARARGAGVAFLEVATDNAAALALYRGAGYGYAGRRRNYYRSGADQAIDAVLLRKTLAAT